jgi:hypothetical protein
LSPTNAALYGRRESALLAMRLMLYFQFKFRHSQPNSPLLFCACFARFSGRATRRKSMSAEPLSPQTPPCESPGPTGTMAPNGSWTRSPVAPAGWRWGERSAPTGGPGTRPAFLVTPQLVVDAIARPPNALPSDFHGGPKLPRFPATGSLVQALTPLARTLPFPVASPKDKAAIQRA